MDTNTQTPVVYKSELFTRVLVVIILYMIVKIILIALYIFAEYGDSHLADAQRDNIDMFFYNIDTSLITQYYDKTTNILDDSYAEEIMQKYKEDCTNESISLAKIITKEFLDEIKKTNNIELLKLFDATESNIALMQTYNHKLHIYTTVYNAGIKFDKLLSKIRFEYINGKTDPIQYKIHEKAVEFAKNHNDFLILFNEDNKIPVNILMDSCTFYFLFLATVMVFKIYWILLVLVILFSIVEGYTHKNWFLLSWLIILLIYVYFIKFIYYYFYTVNKKTNDA
mgnify:CR=1 FL=1